MRSKFHDISRGGRIVLALVVAGMAFGLASAVQAAIPSANGSISGSYAKSGPSQGALARRRRGQPVQAGRGSAQLEPAGSARASRADGPKGDPGPAGPKTVTERQGMVGADGTIYYSSGFTVTHTPGSGYYTIDFPCGTFNWDLDNFPIIDITAFSAAKVTWGTGQEILWGCGGFEASIGTYGSGDKQFMFDVVQRNGPNVPGKAPSQNAKVVIDPS